MQFKAVLAVIAASSVSYTVAAPLANEASVENTLEARDKDAVNFAHQTNAKLQAYNKFRKLFCEPSIPFDYCPYPTLTPITGVNKDNFNDIFYDYDGSRHGNGIRLNDSGTTTWNYKDMQLGIHPNGNVFFKDDQNRNCDVTGGLKGAGCAQFLYYTQGTNVFPGDAQLCLEFGHC